MSIVLDYADGDGNDSPTPADCAAAYASGVRTVIIRGSVTYWDKGVQAYRLRPDRFAIRDAQAWRNAGMVVGFYLFPAFGLHAPSVPAQVANFFASINWKRGIDLPPIFDLEFPGNGIADTGRSQREALLMYQQFLAEIKHVFGVDAITYTSHVEWCDSNGLGNPSADWAGSSPIWIKVPYRLKAHSVPDQVAYAAPVLPPPWAKSGWWLRQGQGDALGFPGIGVHVAATEETPAHLRPTTVDIGDFNPFTADRGAIDSRTDWVLAQLDKVDPSTDVLLTRIVRFQNTHGLKADGIIGPKTFVVLASL